MRNIVQVFLIATLLSLGVQFKANAEENGETVMNAFLATFAKDNINWRHNIVFTNTPEELSAGKQLGFSSLIGYYTYRAKTWDMLNSSEQQEVIESPKLKGFIIALRNPNESPQYANQLNITGVQSSQSPIPKREPLQNSNVQSNFIELPENNTLPQPQATPEVTPVPTPRVTPAPTPKATPTPTPAPTPAPTPKATPAPTPQEIKTYRIEPDDLVGKETISIDLKK